MNADKESKLTQGTERDGGVLGSRGTGKGVEITTKLESAPFCALGRTHISPK